MMREMPSFSARRLACSGAAPPKATSVRSAMATPRSTACTRAAFAMFSSTISATPTAACSAVMPLQLAAMPAASAASAMAGSMAILPPAKRDGSILPMARSASVTVASVPPRP